MPKHFSLGRLNGFVDRHGKPTKNLQRLPEPELQQELMEYRALAEKRDRLVKGSAPDRLSGLRSSLSSSIKSKTFLASAIAYDRVFFDDPIASLVSNCSSFRFGEAQIGREQLVDAIMVLRRLRPLIDSGALVPICLSARHERDEVPITYSEDRFRSCLPASVLEYIRQQAIVKPGEMAGGPIVIYEKEVDSPVDCIAISFANDTRKFGNIWQLADCSAKENGEIEFRVSLDSRNRKAPSKQQFDAWCEQSINQTALARLRAIGIELALAEQLGSYYATESIFEAKLLAFAQKKDVTLAVENPANFLVANQSVLKVDDPLDVLRFRRQNENRILDFQQSLFAMAAELHDCEDFTSASKREFDSKIRPQIESLDQAWSKCVGKVLGNSTVAASAAATMYLNGIDLPLAATLPVAALGALGSSLPTVAEYFAKRKGIAYLWQRLA